MTWALSENVEVSESPWECLSPPRRRSRYKSCMDYTLAEDKRAYCEKKKWYLCHRWQTNPSGGEREKEKVFACPYLFFGCIGIFNFTCTASSPLTPPPPSKNPPSDFNLWLRVERNENSLLADWSSHETQNIWSICFVLRINAPNYCFLFSDTKDTVELFHLPLSWV